MKRVNIFKKLFFKDKNNNNKITFKNKLLKNRIEISIEVNGVKAKLKDFLENYSDKEVEYFKEALIFQEDYEKNILFLEYEDIYDLSVNELEYFSLPSYFKGIIDIKNRGYILNKNGFQFELNFLNFQKKYDYITGNYYVSDPSTGENFFLEKKQMMLVKEIINFNNKNKNFSNIEDQFKLIEFIHKISKEIDLTYSEQLEEFKELETQDNLQIDFVKNLNTDGMLEVVPRIEGLSEEQNKELQKKFKTAQRINQFYELEVEGKSIKLVFNKKLKKALEVIKEEPIISEEDFILKKSKIFNDERLEEEEIEIVYGPRVKGLGYLNYRPTSPPKNSDIDWLKKEFPFIQTLTEKIQLRPEHIDILNEKIEKSTEGEPIILTIDDNKVIIPTIEDAKNEIKKIKNSIINFTQIKNQDDLDKFIEFCEENPEEKHFEKNGFYIKTTDNLESVQEYKKTLKIENTKKEKEKIKSLLLKDNLEDLDYEEKNKIKETKKFKFIRPTSLKDDINLYLHQEEGVAKLQYLYSLNPVNGVLLADDMGLGKTIQILTFLAWLKEHKKEKTFLKALIVMPTSLVNNWSYESNNPKEVGEIQKFFKKDTFKITKFKGRLTEKRINELSNFDIVMTSYESLRLNHVQMGKIKWNVIICDESQKIKNPITLVTTAVKTQNADFKIACSATPIENTSEDLWCLMDFVKPGILGSLKEFRIEFSKPIINNQSKIEAIEKLNNSLKGKIDDFYIRRTKEVLNNDGKFPKKIVKYYNTLPSNEQINKFEEVLAKSYDSKKILAIIQYLLMISSHPDLISESDLVTKNIEELEKESSKIQTLKKILDIIEKNGEKAIIFTKYKKMQKILSLLLNTWYQLSPNIINGDVNTTKRKEALDKFKQSSGFNVIILSPEAAGVGLNITEANHVIHYTRHWNPAKEEQATDRAYRIGQKRDVFVHYPILSYNESYPKVVTYDLDEWIEKELNRNLENSTPEENLNYIIMKKKKMLRDFFLATPLDVDASDFMGVMNRKIK